MSTRVWLQSVLKVSMLGVALLAGCSDDDESGNLVSGNVKSVISNVVQANKNFVVKDLEHFSSDPVASGTSDANGNYSFRVDGPLYLVVLFTVPDEPSPSGLVSVAEGNDDGKDLDDVTSIACAAGVGAVNDGSVPAAEMDRTRIANLELGAAQAIDELDPYHTNHVAEAVARTRELTDDGDHPPSG